MRYHFFLHYRWFFQNLGKEAVPTFMHTTVYVSDFRTIFNRSVPWCNYNRWHLTNYFAPFQRPQGRLNKGVNNDGQTPTIQS